jgi:hypothetical protein
MMSAKLYWEEAVDSGQGHRKTIYDVFSNKRANTTPCTSYQRTILLVKNNNKSGTIIILDDY